MILPVKTALTAATVLLALILPSGGSARAQDLPSLIYDPGHLKPVDSELKVAVGQPAPDFSLPSLSGQRITLSQYRGQRNVVISFVPAAWTPVCSDQWPGYNIAKDIFDRYNAIVLGITVDHLPTLHAWIRQMGGLWFPVLSDFWPHGDVAQRYGVLRTDGMTERALIVIDKAGIIRHLTVSDINRRPNLKTIVDALEAINRSAD